MTDIDYAALDYSRWSFHQRLFQKAFSAVIRVLARVHVEGFEKIPSTDAFVAASNHLHLFDIILYFSIAPRRTIPFVTNRFQTTPFFGWFLTRVGQVIFVTSRKTEATRHKSNRKAIAQGLRVLRSGGILGLTPEGGRSVHGLSSGLPGIAYMANRAPAPILTMAIYGEERAWDYWKRLRRVPVHIRFGPLIELPARKMKIGELQEFTDRIMAEVARLLPPEYQGAYQDAIQAESSESKKTTKYQI